MITIDADVSGPRRHFGDMARRVQQPRTLMGILARDLEDYEREAFATRGFGSWQPDDADTIEQKGGARVLVDDGNLLRQLTTARILGETVVVDRGSAFYGDFLRDGDRGMPRRNPAPKPTRRHVERWADQLLGYIVSGRTR